MYFISNFKEGGGKGSISAIYSWIENVYLCTDLNPDQYKQYLFRPSAFKKPLKQQRKRQKITLNYEKSTKERRIKIQFEDNWGDSAAVKHKTSSAGDCDLARS